MIPDLRQLCDLKPLALADQDRVRAVMAAASMRSYVGFFPWLYGMTLSKKRSLLWETIGSSFCLYIVRRLDGDLRMELYLPPLPFSPEALDKARARCAAFNREKRGRIAIVDDDLRPHVENAGWRLRALETELIYDADAVRAMEGKAFDRLRRKVNKVAREPDLVVRDYEPGDNEGCSALAKTWAAALRETHEGPQAPGIQYVHRCLSTVDQFDPRVMRGQVILRDGRVVAFTFGGTISPHYGVLFVTISDHDIPGLGYFQRQRFIARHDDFRLVNDSSDSGRASLADMKRAFNPVETDTLYRAVID